MEYRFSALSSNKIDRYEVFIFNISGKTGITCNCPATVLCKHIAALITGNSGSTFPTDINDPQALSSAISEIKMSGLTEKYNTLNTELDGLRKEFKEQEREIRSRLKALCVPVLP
ncbi:SWIM zinc finger family protein [Lelliottia aquatilis]|uniref:SWIM zinc finger family protein n=1 Tax=Lelliottia aquatilis TaxID=2080838 RepID=UPI001056E96F|nr:SWIM zinc finger family protein [Lelliottia aquatilis]